MYIDIKKVYCMFCNFVMRKIVVKLMCLRVLFLLLFEILLLIFKGKMVFIIWCMFLNILIMKYKI